MNYYLSIGILLLFWINSHAQPKSPNGMVNAKVWRLSVLPTENPKQLFQNGKLMLQYSVTDADRAKSYGHMGDAMFKQNKYDSALFLFAKADSFARKSGFYSERIMINVLLAKLCGEIGVTQKEIDYFNIAIMLSEKYKMSPVNISGMKAIINEVQDKYLLGIHYRKEVCKQLYTDSLGKNELALNLAVSYLCISYDYLMLNNLQQGKKYLHLSDSTFALIKDTTKSFLTYNYLCNGLINQKQGDIKAANLWFRKAIELAKTLQIATLNKLVIRTCMLKSYNGMVIDSNWVQNYFSLEKDDKIEISKALNYLDKLEEQKNQSEHSKSVKIFIASLIVGLLICMASILLILRKYKNKKQRNNNTEVATPDNPYEDPKVMQPSEKTTVLEEDIISDNKKDNDEGELSTAIAESTELELLEKIEIFETGNAYTDKSFNMSAMCSLLNSNSKYINLILKKYRAQSFSDYINMLRIKFVVHKLETEPEFLTYKIHYLSEISGFNTHSRFAYIFKKIMNISPSEYIEELHQNKTKEFKNKS